MVAFHSQQCVEKTLKAILEFYGVDVPRIHSTLRLYNFISDKLPFTLDEAILEKLDSVYISSRYPGELGLMPYGKPTQLDARKFYEFAREIYDRTKEFIEKNEG